MEVPVPQPGGSMTLGTVLGPSAMLHFPQPTPDPEQPGKEPRLGT